MHTRLLDARDRTWIIAVTPYEYQRIREQCDVDLYDIVVPGKQLEILKRLETDDVLLVNVLWCICEEQAESAKVTKTEFTKGFFGDALEKGYQSIVDALAFFFRSPSHRELMRKLAEYLAAVNKEIAAEMIPTIKGIYAQAVAKKFVASVMSSPESSDSTSKTKRVRGGGIRLASSQ